MAPWYVFSRTFAANCSAKFVRFIFCFSTLLTTFLRLCLNLYQTLGKHILVFFPIVLSQIGDVICRHSGVYGRTRTACRVFKPNAATFEQSVLGEIYLGCGLDLCPRMFCLAKFIEFINILLKHGILSAQFFEGLLVLYLPDFGS